MDKDTILALSVYAVLFAVAFTLSIGFALGGAESHHDPASPLLYLRRGLMIAAALVIPRVTRRQGPSALGFRVSPRWLAIALGVGFLMGFGNPGGFNPTVPAALLLALFHTFATELFFRGYLFKTFESSFKGIWAPIILSSFCYGLFYLTTWPIWARPPLVKLVFVFLFTLVGIPFAYGYKKSGSFLVPWMMHFFGVLKYRMLF